LKLLHIADIHLGIKALGFGDRADDLRGRIQIAFESSLQIAAERACDVVLVAGDLFDSNRVGRRTLHAATSALQNLLAAAPQTHIFLIPGNHDCLGDDSIYHASEFSQLGDRFHLLTDPQGETVYLEHLDAAIHGVPFVCDFKQLDIQPLAMLSPHPQAAFNIAMLHVGIPMSHWDGADAPSTSPEQIAASGMDYIALGHFHNAQNCDDGGVVARYPGPPELINMQSPPGAPLLVEMTASGVSVEAVPVASLRLEKAEILAAELQSGADLTEKLRAYAAQDLVLDADIVGMLPLGVRLQTEQLAEELADDFYRLSLTDNTAVAALDIDEAQYPEEFVTGKFIRMMQERIQQVQAEGDEHAARIAAEALRLGVHLLQGGELE